MKILPDEGALPPPTNGAAGVYKMTRHRSRSRVAKRALLRPKRCRQFLANTHTPRTIQSAAVIAALYETREATG